MATVSKTYASHSAAKAALVRKANTIHANGTTGTYGFTNLVVNGNELTVSSAYHAQSTLQKFLKVGKRAFN